MKQKFLLLISLVLLAVQGWALPVDESSARAIVQDFVIEKRGINPNSVPTSGSSDFQLLHAEMSSVNVTMNAYYIFNTGDGFVIIAGDDRAEQILGYGDEELDMNDIPCCMQFMLDSYKEQIDYLLEHPELEVETPSMNAPMLTATSVAPMLTAKFGQGEPFYNLTPLYNGKHCKTGCSCVALCQVMHYWKFPTTPVPSLPSYVSRFRGVIINVPELPSDRFHWNYIKDSYSGSYTADEAYSVAKLMRYAGQAEHMGYTLEASGASTDDILYAAKLFGYNRNAMRLDRDDYTDAEWAALIQAELIAGRPIVYAGFNKSYTSGHAFNIDGYRASDKKYHINWGWNGGNGYYALNAFNSTSFNYNYHQSMIAGLEPQDPEIVIITPATLSFSAKAGETKTATFDLKGYALTGDLTVKLNNGGNVYSIDKTSITMSEAAYRTTVTVTYKPTEVGTNNASVTISGGGAASKTVTLKGTASAASTIITTPSSLSFNAYVGETKTETFTVKCPNAISNLKLTLNNGGSIYSIDKTSISKNAANSGVNVTVTYKPTNAGTSSASVTISGGGANPQTISLSGTATIKPEITVTPKSLSFGSVYVGESETATFIVSGKNLTGNLSLKLRSLDDIFLIDKTSIAKNDAANGTTVTVTFKPKAGGVNSTDVEITGDGADTMTVNLCGSAIKPEITVSPDTLSFCSYVGKTVMEKITVKGTCLRGDLSLALNDSSGNFSIATTSLTPSGSSIYANVTVTYNPVVAGESVALLTVSGGGADPQTVVLTGVAEELPNVEVDVNSLSFESTYTGYQTSRTITITCPNLPDNLQLSLSNDGTGSFGLSKSVITPEAAAAGASVTVYFSPTTGGGKHARLNICYDGCKVVTIPVSGVGIKSDGYITAWPTSLEFEAQPGSTVTKTFNVSYSYPNGSIMISSVGGNGESGSNGNGGSEGALQSLNTAISGLSWANSTIIPFDGTIEWRRKDFIDPILPVLFKSLVLEVTGDECFEVTPSKISFRSVPHSATVTVTYHPDYVGEHDAVLTIKLSGGSAKPFIMPLHGTATSQLNAPSFDNDGNDLMITQSGSSINTLVDEMLMNIKVYAEGQSIIIECPEADNAIISDIAGHAWRVNLQAGRNEIPVNASGIYIVRIREKITKLMLK